MKMLPVSVEGAVVRRQGKRLIGPIDLTLGESGVTIVVGPNGAGKTTLLRMLHGLERVRTGKVAWGCSKADAQRRQAFVFQHPVLMRRSVRDNIAYALQVSGVPVKEARERAEHWAAQVGLGDALERRATVLSGGERQKMALARALIRDPEVVFLDEPCSSLDGSAIREIEDILTSVSDKGTRLIMSTHDMGQARRLATEVVFMLHGRIHEMAPASQFFEAPQTPQSLAFINGDIVE